MWAQGGGDGVRPRLDLRPHRLADVARWPVVRRGADPHRCRAGDVDDPAGHDGRLPQLPPPRALRPGADHPRRRVRRPAHGRPGGGRRGLGRDHPRPGAVVRVGAGRSLRRVRPPARPRAARPDHHLHRRALQRRRGAEPARLRAAAAGALRHRRHRSQGHAARRRARGRLGDERVAIACGTPAPRAGGRGAGARARCSASTTTAPRPGATRPRWTASWSRGRAWTAASVRWPPGRRPDAAYEEIGVTDLVVHWPRPTEPYEGDPAILEHLVD